MSAEKIAAGLKQRGTVCQRGNRECQLNALTRIEKEYLSMGLAGHHALLLAQHDVGMFHDANDLPDETKVTWVEAQAARQAAEQEAQAAEQEAAQRVTSVDRIAAGLRSRGGVV